MPTRVVAADGDTLCGLAIAAGFLNCQPLRDQAANSALLNRPLQAGDVVLIPDIELREENRGSETQNLFVAENAPPFSIRFVHGSPDKPYLEDDTLTELNVSCFVTNRGGTNGQVAFPTAFEFQQAGHDDPDTFKIEVVDPQAGAEVDVTIEPLKPTFDASGAVNGHTPFVGATRTSRLLNAKAKKVRSGVAYRTKYLRLVVDDVDRQALPAQTVVTSEFGGDPAVEILDQDVKASYERQTCPAPAGSKCTATAVLPLNRGNKVFLVIRALRATPNGVVETTRGGPNDNGLVQLDDIQLRLEVVCRLHWAQAQLRFSAIRLETVDPPSNMISVADQTANLAQGVSASGAPGQISFTLNVQRFGSILSSTHAIGPIVQPPGSTPENTANLVRDAINAIPNLTARTSLNPPEVGVGLATAPATAGSADVLITDSAGGRATVTNLTPAAQQDKLQKVVVADVLNDPHIRNAFGNYHVGHPEERNLFKSMHTLRNDVIHVVVVHAIPGSGLNGFTVVENKHLNANRQLAGDMKNSVMVDVGSADGNMNSIFILPHEIGHALLDDAQHADSNRQLMFPTMPSHSTAVTDTKRLHSLDPVAPNWNQLHQNANGSIGNEHIRMNVRRRVRDASANLLH